MSSSLYSLGERVSKEIQARQTTESKVTLPQCILAVGSARDVVVRNKIMQDYNAERSVYSSNYLSEFGFDTKLNPTWDADRNLYSLVLPAKPIELPFNGAIKEVYIKGQNNFNFIQRSPFNGNLYRGLAASTLPRPSFFQKGGSIYFSEDSVGEQSCIIITMIAESKYLDNRATLPIDGDMEIEIMARAKEMLLAPNLPEDVVTDGIGT